MYQVLIVDEDPGFLAIMKIFLEHSGRIYADTVFTADEALEILSGGLYDAVIFGTLQEGIRDGTIIRTIRESAGPVPVILMVEEYQAEEGVLALKQGISHVIVRTIDPKDQFHELATAIIDQVNQSREAVAFQSHDAILSLVTRYAQRFLTVSVDPDEIAALFSSFGSITGVARVSLISLKPDQTVMPVPEIVVSWHANGIKPRLPLPDPVHVACMKGQVLHRITGEIRERRNFISSVREFSHEELEEGDFTSITGILAVPVVAGRDVWGGIIIEDSERERSWSEIEIDAIIGMADIIGAALYSEAQKERVRFLSVMVQQVSDAVIAYNCDERIVYANTAAEILFGTDTDTLKGQDINTFFPDFTWRGDGDGSPSIPYATIVRTADDREIMVDMKVTMLWSGKYAGTSVAVMRDATERIHHHQMQSEAFSRIDRDIRMMEKLGEDIRDPLMIILGHAELFGGKSAEIIVSQVHEIQRKMQDLDCAQLKSVCYRKILRDSYADISPVNDEGEKRCQ